MQYCIRKKVIFWGGYRFRFYRLDCPSRCSIAEASDRPPTEARGALARTSREGLFTTLLPLPCPSTIGGSISRSVLLRSDDDIEFILFKMVNIVAVRSLACCGTVLVYKGRQRSFFLSPLFSSSFLLAFLHLAKDVALA